MNYKRTIILLLIFSLIAMSACSAKPEESKSVETIHIAYMDDIYENVPEMVARFNRIDHKYNAVAKIYSKEELEYLIANGESPDVVFYNDYSQPSALNTASGQFRDLLPMLESSSLKAESFIPGLIDGIMVNGQLNELWCSTAICYWAGDSKFFVERQNISWDDCLKKASELGDSYTVVNQEINKEKMLQMFLATDVNEYIDSEGNVRFDSDEFKKLLKACNDTGIEYSPIRDSDDRGYEYEKYMENYIDRKELIYLDMINSCYGTLSPDVVNVTSPFSENTAAIIESPFGSKVCIPQRAENVDGAWMFICNIMSKESQIDNIDNKLSVSYPVNKEAFNYLVNEILNESDGALVSSIFELQPQVINYEKIDIIKISIDEAKDYFNGEQTIEETVDTIQEKVSAYLSEQYG